MIASKSRTTRMGGRERTGSSLLLFGLLWAAIAGACGTHPSGARWEGSTSDAGLSTGDAGVSESGTSLPFLLDGSLLLNLDGASSALAIAPADKMIDVAYGQSTPTITYTATVHGSPVAASFSIDRANIAAIAAGTGVMTPTGTVGGTARVSATYNGATVSTQVTVNLHLVDVGAPAGTPGVDAGGAGGAGGVGGEGPGGPVSQAGQTVLGGPAATDSGLAWLYPYDKTVWPRGLLAPLLQWNAPRSYDAVYIHLKETAFEYKGFFTKTATPFVHHPIPQAAWDALSYSNQGEAVTVTLVFEAGGSAYGPLIQTWKIAQGTLKGTVYYNSYGTNLAQNFCCTINGQMFGGATLGITHGATAPVLVAGNNQECRVCHSVSADGSRLVTQGDPNNAISSAYDLKNGNTQTVMSPADSRFAWAALYPNGQFLLSDGAPWGGAVGLQGAGWNGDAQLFSIPAGTSVASTGIPAGLRAGSPVFSPDGKHVAFNFVAGPGADGNSLAAMDYDPVKSAFSNLRVLYQPPAGMVVWPTFMPTDDAVVFELETLNNGRDWGGTRASCDSTTGACANTGAQGKLMWIDVATQTAASLDLLNGGTYLPALAATQHTSDSVLNFEPTVSPLASGGYAWVVFTSRRLYGNVATINPYWSDPRYQDLSTSPTPKKLWAAAIDLNAKPGTDPSHPAFYVPAQELLAGNSRGFWVFDACHANGAACQTGDECCGGYCEVVDGRSVCGNTPPPTNCSNEFDRCTTTSDCCGAPLGFTCIGGVCSRSTPPQ